MTATIERALRTACVEMGDAMITCIADHFKIDAEELRRVSGVCDMEVTTKKPAVKKERKPAAPKKAKKVVPSLPLPFTGVINESDCHGIRLNHSLHTQCTNDRPKDGDYCKTCAKQSAKNASGKPNYGDIRDRLECPLLEFRDPKGKQTLPYINVVEKLKLDMETVKAEAAKFGVVIPEEHMVKRDSRRGRPKKEDTDVSDTSSETSSTAKKQRGRPRKEKQMESVVGDDLLTALKNAQENAKLHIASILPKKKVLITDDEQDAEADDAKSTDGGSVSTSKTSGSKSRLTDEEKAAKKAEREAAKAAKEAEKAAAKAAKDAEREAAKAAKEAEKAEKEAEKQRKAEEKAAAKAAKEAEKEAEKKRKAEEKAAAKAAKEAEKEAKKAAKSKSTESSKATSPIVLEDKEEFGGCAAGAEEAKKEAKADEDTKEETVSEPEVEAVEEASDDDDAPVTVRKFEFNGTTYLRSSDNVLYDVDTQEPVWHYNPETKTVEEVDAPSDDEEEEED